MKKQKTAPMDGVQNPEVEDAKHLIAELCKSLYTQGHVSGTGGGISIKVGDFIVMAPSGVQKERMVADDMFVLDAQGEILHTPEARPPPYKPPKLSECSPLFMSAYELRNAGAVLHGHSMNAMLATLLNPDADEFKITHIEMIKGIAGHGFYSNMVVPIIENTARECELTDRLREAIQKYPMSNAVLVRRHGVYVWGDNWIHAKTQFECYEYLFEAAVRMRQLGIDHEKAVPINPALVQPQSPLPSENGASANGARQLGNSAKAKPAPKTIVLDIEGTVLPISFVADVLFPYARSRLKGHLEESFDGEQTQKAVQLIRQQALTDGIAFPDSSAPKEEIIQAAVSYCEASIDADRKTTALKTLQGHIWTKGFSQGALRAELYRDVPDALATWARSGIKVYIYSSGSRQAQRDLFSHTTVGDLRPYLCGFFDTTSGSKVEASSYENIAQNLGVDSPNDILFVTDNIMECRAAATVGWHTVLADRPGNKPLPQDCEFKIITSLTELI
jgi:methylthioribulose 1-phosphate dehydratase/enolase-phosphatase E1